MDYIDYRIRDLELLDSMPPVLEEEEYVPPEERVNEEYYIDHN